ncbi:hypothetical protein BIW11_03747, partial [Tropilaelaps mercedesae]
MEMVSRVAFLWRLLRTVFYMVMVIHINACAYFIVSRIQGIHLGTLNCKIAEISKYPCHEKL